MGTQVAARSAVHGVVVGQSLGIVERKPVVMAAGKRDVAHAGRAGGGGDAACVEVFGGEGLSEASILVHGHVVQVLHPLTLP